MPLDRADNEAGKVKVAGPIDVGHHCGLAADKRAAVVAAGFAQSLHDFEQGCGRQLRVGDVVEKEQRPRPECQDVID